MEEAVQLALHMSVKGERFRIEAHVGAALRHHGQGLNAVQAEEIAGTLLSLLFKEITLMRSGHGGYSLLDRTSYIMATCRRGPGNLRYPKKIINQYHGGPVEWGG